MPAPLVAEAGESAVTAIFGVGIFLGFLLLATQVILYLFTATVVQAAAVDGANHGAGAAQTDSVNAAEVRAADVLGGFAVGADIEGRIVPDTAGAVLEVRIRVQAPAIVAAGLGLATVERQATARVEG